MTVKWNPSSSQVVTKHDSVITIHDSSDYYILREHVITIYDGYVVTIHDNCYYISRQVLQYTTSVITIHDIIKFHDSTHALVKRIAI